MRKRIKKLEARNAPRIPQEAAIIEPGPGEDNQTAKVRHMAAHPEQVGAPIIFLRMAREVSA
jgi:hypothetical protein